MKCPYRRFSDECDQYPFCSVDPGIYTHLPRRNLAVLAAERGDRAAAALLWQAVLTECPGDPEAEKQLMLLGRDMTPEVAA